MKLMQNTDKVRILLVTLNHCRVMHLCNSAEFLFVLKPVCLDQMLQHLNTMLITTNNGPRLNSAGVTISVLELHPFTIGKIDEIFGFSFLTEVCLYQK